ncbi:hypothetical protein HCC30_25715 [Streptomyces sp. HNM0574]|nr:hypothetical protein [Streptomyces sp. HNM0574]
MGEEAVLTPAQHLRALLTRVQNPFEVSDVTLGRLEQAVLHRVEPHGARLSRHAPAHAVRCGGYRHSFLLTDGSGLPLWELRYDSPEADGGQLAEVYEDESTLRRAERRVQERSGGTGPYDPFDPHTALDRLEHPLDGPPGGAGHRFVGARPGGRRYGEGNSPEHARRLLRRAENADRPGDETLRLLATARGHEIVHVPKPHALARQWHVWCSVYEHAFLLEDGREISLYELEHDLTGTGRLVCEVYLEEDVADRAAHRHARNHGIGG